MTVEERMTGTTAPSVCVGLRMCGEGLDTQEWSWLVQEVLAEMKYQQVKLNEEYKEVALFFFIS